MTYPSKCFEALGDPTRRLVFERLAGRSLPVVEIARGLKVSRPAVSQHLKVLINAGLVTRRQVGTRHLCEMNPEGVNAMRKYLDSFWDQALVAFKKAAEQNTNQ